MYSNTLTLSTDLRFNLNPNFRMSLKSSRYPSNNTSFRSPQFTKMPGTGGTGAYGDVSDGGSPYFPNPLNIGDWGGSTFRGYYINAFSCVLTHRLDHAGGDHVGANLWLYPFDKAVENKLIDIEYTIDGGSLTKTSAAPYWEGNTFIDIELKKMNGAIAMPINEGFLGLGTGNFWKGVLKITLDYQGRKQTYSIDIRF